MVRVLSVFLLAVMTSACAFGDAELAIGFNPEEARRGLISEAPPATIYLADVQDERSDKERIGYKRNGYGMKTADILSDRPAPEIVKDALAAMLEANNHALGGPDARYALQTTLNNFWFDYKAGFVSVEFYGSVQAALSLVDQSNGESLYAETFDGYYSEKTGGGLNRTWERVMNAALADLVNKANLSPGFAEALRQAAEADAAPEETAPEADAVGS